jgi:uncharacterized protein (TIGR02145 family)
MFDWIRLCPLAMALSALTLLAIDPFQVSAQHETASATARYSVRRMADGKQWTTVNLSVNTVRSYCYDDSEANCVRYGRLYTWESASRACQSLGEDWRLPTDNEWRQLANHYGGVSADSKDGGKTSFKALSMDGDAKFNAVLGGGRSEEGQYARLQAHGFYWTSSEDGAASAWFYNFAKGSQGLHRQANGEKDRAFSVRCISN